MKRSRFKLKPCTLIAASVSLIFMQAAALANPTGPQVVNGAVSFQQPNVSTLNITNSPGSIINWQGFSIGAGEVTRFLQQSASSAVLNRVVGSNFSQIYGQLLSNGRVFLINPGGIVVGPGAIVDTAGFVASTLNMLDSDFLAGKLRFQSDTASGPIINQGWIRTGYGGQVILVAPRIENSGLIQTPGGELILAAGQKLTVSSLDLEGVQFEVQAPTDTVVNVGKLLADGGAVGVFAGTLRHSGEIRANALAYDEAGRIVLRAQSEIQIAAGSTISADGGIGGSITLQSSAGLARVAGAVSAQGSAGKGGEIRVLGDRVAIVESAVIDASGSAGGGQILVGGDFQGGNPGVQNSSNTFVGSGAALRADATQSGDGGRIIVWSDDKTQFYGALSAQGGPDGGNGGFAEVSGKQNLVFAGGANLGAPKGSLGTLLLDPLDLFVFSGGGVETSIINEATDFPTNAATVSPGNLAAISGNVSLFASRYMRIGRDVASDSFTLALNQSLTAQVGTYTVPASGPLALSTVPNRLDIGANITTQNGDVSLSAPAIQIGANISTTGGGAVSLIAPTIQSSATSAISTTGGRIDLQATGTIFGSLLSLNAGSGPITVTPDTGSTVQLGAVTGGSFTATRAGSISTGVVTTTGGTVSLTSTGSAVSASGGITTSGGDVALTGASSVTNFGTISAGGGAVSLTGSTINGGTINTAGSVMLTANSGSIFATVNNASSLTASATDGFGTTVNIGSSTDLKVNTISANCGGFTCPSTVSLSTSAGSILATSASSQITAGDVTLTTGTLTSGNAIEGGRIGTAALPLNVDVKRTFTFSPNNDFTVVLNGTGPNGLDVRMGVASPGDSYSTGSLTKSGGGLTLSASATDSTVTLTNLSITSGFDQRVFNNFPDPSIIFRVPNGALIANSVTVPAGATTVAPPNSTIPALPVTLRASGDLTLTSYSRTSGGLAKMTTIQSDGGTVTLGAISASNDNVTVTSFGAVQPQNINDAGFEINTTGAIVISGSSIGANAGSNPLDLQGSSITLTTTSGAIGGTNPVIAKTPVLEIDAASTFNVSTGTSALTSLTVTADPGSVGSGPGQVSTAGDVDVYTFDANASPGDFRFNPPLSTGRSLTFTSTSGDINLGTVSGVSLGTGNLSITAQGGSINTSGNSIAAAGVALTANGDIDTDTGTVTASTDSITLLANTNVITGDLNAPTSITIGREQCCSYPAVSVGAIGISTAPGAITINGTTVDIGGAVMGTGNITLNANNGLLTLGGAVATSGTGKTISLLSTDASNALQFTSVNAGSSGTVTINSNKGIDQTVDVVSGGGITAGTVTLNAGDGGMADSSDGALDLIGVTSLTVNTGGTGSVALDGNGSTLSSLTISKTSTSPFSLASLTGQSVSLVLSTNLALAVNSSPTPLIFTLNYTAGGIDLAGTGIATSGGNVTLTASGGFNGTTGGIDTTGGTGGFVHITASGGSVNSGAISTGGKEVTIFANGAVTTGVIDTTGASNTGGFLTVTTNNATGNINVNNSVTTGPGTVTLQAFNAGSITGSGIIDSGASVTATTNNGDIGVSANKLQINAPSVTLGANGTGVSAGHVYANLPGTTTSLTLTGDVGFDVTSTSPFSTLSVTTKGSETGNLILAGDGGSQTFSLTRPVVGTFKVGSTGGAALTNATFRASDGDLLVAGGAIINAANLTLETQTGNVKLDGTVLPLSLNTGYATQTFNAGQDLLITGNVTLAATTSQSFSANGNITVQAQGGSIAITAPDQTFETTGSSSTMEFLGGMGTGEKVTVSATNSQRINAISSSADSFKLKGGDGTDASVTLSHSGTGIQDFQMLAGTVTVEGGRGQNAYAKIEETGVNLQRICRFVINQGCVPVSGLQILGGSGIGAYGQVTSVGSQDIGVSGATLVKGGTGNGAYALLQAGTTQNIFGGGNLTVQGRGGAGVTANAQILAGSFQSISGSAMSLLAGTGPDSFALISTPGNQTINYSSLALSAASGGSGSYVEIQAGGTQTLTGFGNFQLTAGSAPNTDAIIEGSSQTINGGVITLTGGTGASGSTSDAVVRNLAGNQRFLNTSAITLNGGVDFSTTGILNLGAGTQTINSSGAVSLNSNAASTAAAPVLIQNVPATLQSIDARSISVQTASGSAASAQVFSGGNQWIHSNNPTLTGSSVLVAAGGTGTASIEATASQLLEIDYPQLMQGVVRNGNLTIGDSAGLGTSRIQAADQNIFAGAITIQGPAGDNMKSELKASGAQVITTLQGGIDVFGGSGDNTIAQIDPTTQTILTNGTISVEGGSGINSIAQIVAATGTTTNGQTILVTNGNISLTGGNNSGAAAFITNTGTSSFVGASGGISLIAGSAPGADAIISVGNGPGVLTFSCGGIVGSCTFPSLGASPTAGILANQPSGSFDTTSLTLPLQQDVSSALIEITLAGATEEPIFGRRVPVCR